MHLHRTKNMPRATLKTIADAVGLDISTVSRVINGTEEQAKKAASKLRIAQIRELARDMNYRPNPYAIGLRTQKSKTVGVLMPRLSDVVIAMIYEGIDAAAYENGYATFAFSTFDSVERQRSFGQIAMDRQVEGLIITDARLDDTRFLDDLADCGMPFMLVARKVKEYCSVTCDDYKGGQLAAEHLICEGHKEIGILGGPLYTQSSVNRVHGFIETLSNHGISINPSFKMHGQFDSEAGRLAGEKLLDADHIPTAIFAVNDYLAIGFMGAMRDRGIIAGRDLAILGYNDIPIAKELPVPLSSIHSELHEIGYRGMTLLLEKLKGKSPNSEIIKPALRVRETSIGVNI